MAKIIRMIPLSEKQKKHNVKMLTELVKNLNVYEKQAVINKIKKEQNNGEN